MAFPVNLVKIEQRWIMPNTAAAVNVLHAEFPATPTIAGMTDLADEFVSCWNGGGVYTALGVKNWFPSQLVHDGIRVTAIGQPAPIPEVIRGGGAVGGGSSPVANESSVVSTWTTGFIGRSFRGRTFWPCPAEFAVENNGTMLAQAVTDMRSDLQKLIVAVLAGTGTPELVVYSPFTGATTPILNVTVRDTIHHQSRRNA